MIIHIEKYKHSIGTVLGRGSTFKDDGRIKRDRQRETERQRQRYHLEREQRQ